MKEDGGEGRKREGRKCRVPLPTFEQFNHCSHGYKRLRNIVVKLLFLAGDCLVHTALLFLFYASA